MQQHISQGSSKKTYKWKQNTVLNSLGNSNQLLTPGIKLVYKHKLGSGVHAGPGSTSPFIVTKSVSLPVTQHALILHGLLHLLSVN